ncbi:hypothetical protein PENTCL1PPCAC_4523, partial [Pristionchus entomophagus]
AQVHGLSFCRSISSDPESFNMHHHVTIAFGCGEVVVCITSQQGQDSEFTTDYDQLSCLKKISSEISYTKKFIEILTDTVLASFFCASFIIWLNDDWYLFMLYNTIMNSAIALATIIIYLFTTGYLKTLLRHNRNTSIPSGFQRTTASLLILFDIVCRLIFDDYYFKFDIVKNLTTKEDVSATVFYRKAIPIIYNLREVWFPTLLLIVFPKFRLLFLGRDINQPSTIAPSTLLRSSTV